MDYDFSLADNAAMSSGVAARTIVLDRMESEYAGEHLDATVINMAWVWMRDSIGSIADGFSGTA